MQLTPEQSNIILNGILIILSVVVGGGITLLSSWITSSYQKHQGNLKFRKEIYETRFSDCENYLNELMVLARNFGEELEKEESYDVIENNLRKILHHGARFDLLSGLQITSDNNILMTVRNLFIELDNLCKTINKFLEAPSDNELKKTIFQKIFSLEGAFVDLKLRIDDFRLNDYKPLNKLNRDITKIPPDKFQGDS